MLGKVGHFGDNSSKGTISIVRKLKVEFLTQFDLFLHGTYSKFHYRIGSPR